jgi:hypothetical protein
MYFNFLPYVGCQTCFLLFAGLFKIFEASWENKIDSLKKKYFLNKCCLAYEIYLQDHCIPICVKDMLTCFTSKESDQENIMTTCATSGATVCVRQLPIKRIKKKKKNHL